MMKGTTRSEERPADRRWGSEREFITAMAHLYRGEVSRANTWRTRLDATTNWAVVTVAGVFTVAFSSAQHHHFVLLLALLLVLTFLNIEARRYRYYLLWSYRVHLLETDFFAPLLVSPSRPASDWADHLAESLLHPSFPMAYWDAIGRRFRRNYVWLVTLLVLSWAAKLFLHPVPTRDWGTVLARAAVGPVEGTVVIAAVGLVCGGLAGVSIASLLLPAWGRAIPEVVRRIRKGAGPLMPEPEPRERLATIITSHGQEMARRIIEELQRGVTALAGTGMYTSEARDVLLCAVTDVQVPYLEEIARQTDPGSFVVVSPAEEVRGKGFRPFEPPS